MAAAPANLADLVGMPATERNAVLARMTREEQDEAMRRAPLADLIRAGKNAAAELGTYRYRLVKQERVKGKMLDPQEIVAYVRPSPFAVRLRYVKGPAKGRNVLYNAALRENELRAREAGLLGVAAVWIGIDSAMAKRDTNHKVTDMGFQALFARFDRDIERARPKGGFRVEPEGFDEQGNWCAKYVAPPGAGTYAEACRICSNLKTALPSRVEAFEGQQVKERYHFFDVEGPIEVPKDFFTPAGAGL